MWPESKPLHDLPGIHSIGEFSLSVPDLDDAVRFYSAFGLDVQTHDRHADLYTADGYRWGRVVAGERKFLRHLTLHCFDEDFDGLQHNLDGLECARLSAPAWSDPLSDNFRSLWLRDPDGLLVQLRAGPKTSLHAAVRAQPAPYVDGVRAAQYRRQIAAVKPQRLSHLARLTANVDTLVDFYARAFGLRLSDRSGKHVAFMHGRHGSDHHLLAFAGSSGAALHHLSWDVPTIEDVGLGAMNMVAQGYKKGWGVGRHVLGSNYFYYVEDPWGSFCEYSSGMDFIPASMDWQPLDHAPEDAFFLWGPDVPPQMLVNSEAD